VFLFILTLAFDRFRLAFALSAELQRLS